MIDVTGGNKIYYYHYDGLGSVIALSNENGNIVECYEYDVFGACTIHTDPGPDGQWMTADDEISWISSVGNPYMFTGRRYDSETGLYYYRARYYDPYIGGFLEPDSLGLMPDGAPRNPFNPLSNTAPGNHLYAYCYNEPINMVGPYGFGAKWWYCLKCAWKLRGVAEKCGSGECAHVCDDPVRRRALLMRYLTVQNACVLKEKMYS